MADPVILPEPEPLPAPDPSTEPAPPLDPGPPAEPQPTPQGCNFPAPDLALPFDPPPSELFIHLASLERRMVWFKDDELAEVVRFNDVIAMLIDLDLLD